jgi:hypothetical protein
MKKMKILVRELSENVKKSSAQVSAVKQFYVEILLGSTATALSS